MKRYGDLYSAIVSFENLWLAARRAQRGKRYRDDVLSFNYNIEARIWSLKETLTKKTWLPGPYKTFIILEPKRRLISAAPYEDRVVHHALCNIIGPLFEKRFLPSTYANRTGLGTHAALGHFRHCAQQKKYAFCLRADIEKYFPSIDHALLKESIRRTIKCVGTLWLTNAILDGSNAQEPVEQYFEGDDLLTSATRRAGLPIGNLSSQLWSNVYLDVVDHAMASRYGGRRYLRYVDDFALFSNDVIELREAKAFLEQKLTALRLKLHPSKTAIHRMSEGVNFLGFRFFPERVRIRQENLRRARRRLRGIAKSYCNGNISVPEVRNSIQSWLAHIRYGDTFQITDKVLNGLVFSRA